MTMPQVRIHGVDDVRLDTVQKPVITENDVLVQVSLCGICGSDLGFIAMGGLGMTHPMPLGHELVGIACEVGNNVEHVKTGDRVVIDPTASNMTGNGGPDGGFAPFLLVSDANADVRKVIPVPASLTAEQAAMIEPLSVAMHACNQARPTASDKAVIFGAGPIGLCAVTCLKYLGVKDIVVVDLSDFRLDRAKALGAVTFKPDHAAKEKGNGLSDFLIAQHGASDVMGSTVPASNIYLEATGAKPVFEQIVSIAQTGSRVVVVGVHKQPVELDLVTVLIKELSIIGSMAYPNEFPQVIDMLESGNVNVEPLISHRFALSDFENALAQAKDTDSAAKILVDCQH